MSKTGTAKSSNYISHPVSEKALQLHQYELHKEEQMKQHKMGPYATKTKTKAPIPPPRNPLRGHPPQLPLIQPFTEIPVDSILNPKPRPQNGVKDTYDPREAVWNRSIPSRAKRADSQLEHKSQVELKVRTKADAKVKTELKAKVEPKGASAHSVTECNGDLDVAIQVGLEAKVDKSTTAGSSKSNEESTKVQVEVEAPPARRGLMARLGLKDCRRTALASVPDDEPTNIKVEVKVNAPHPGGWKSNMGLQGVPLPLVTCDDEATGWIKTSTESSFEADPVAYDTVEPSASTARLARPVLRVDTRPQVLGTSEPIKITRPLTPHPAYDSPKYMSRACDIDNYQSEVQRETNAHMQPPAAPRIRPVALPPCDSSVHPFEAMSCVDIGPSAFNFGDLDDIAIWTKGIIGLFPMERVRVSRFEPKNPLVLKRELIRERLSRAIRNLRELRAKHMACCLLHREVQYVSHVLLNFNRQLLTTGNRGRTGSRSRPAPDGAPRGPSLARGALERYLEPCRLPLGCLE